MGGKFRPAVIAGSALALLVIGSPVAVLTGPLAAHHVAAAPPDAKHASKGNDHDAKAAPQVPAPVESASAAQDSAAPAIAPPQLSPTQPVATRAATANGVGTRSLPAQIELSRPRTGQPSERADHASAGSLGRHLGAGPDTDATGTSSPSLTASTTIASSGTPAAGTQAATTSPTVSRAATNNPGGTSTPPPVAVEPPAAPQTNPPLSTQPALTGTRLDWILVGVVVALAAAVVAAVRMATLRGRRPPR